MRIMPLLFSAAFAAGCTTDYTYNIINGGMSPGDLTAPAGDEGGVTDGATRADGSPGADGSHGTDSGAATDAGMDAGPDMACKSVTLPCGRCGTKTGTCNPDGTLSFGACTGEHGTCDPGAVQYTGNCDFRTCQPNCFWGGWGEKPGAQCADGESRSCDAGIFCSHEGHYDCLPTCKWGPCMCN